MKDESVITCFINRSKGMLQIEVNQEISFESLKMAFYETYM